MLWKKTKSSESADKKKTLKEQHPPAGFAGRTTHEHLHYSHIRSHFYSENTFDGLGLEMVAFPRRCCGSQACSTPINSSVSVFFL